MPAAITTPYTRLKGPLLMGQIASTADNVDMSPDLGLGSATRPLYAYIGDPDTGMYLRSSGENAIVVGGVDLISFSSSRMAFISTASNSLAYSFVIPTSFVTSSGSDGFLYISQTSVSVTSSSGTSTKNAPTAFGKGVAVLYDSARQKLCVFSTVDNTWLGVTLTSS